MNFPILSSLILLPTIGALFLFFTKNEEGNNLTPKYAALFTSVVNFLISIYLWISFDQSTSTQKFFLSPNESFMLNAHLESESDG